MAGARLGLLEVKLAHMENENLVRSIYYPIKGADTLSLKVLRFLGPFKF